MKSATEAPASETSVPELGAVWFGRNLYFVFALEATRDLQVFEIRTVSRTNLKEFRTGPFSDPAQAFTRDTADERSSLDVALIRANGANVEVVVVHYGGEHTLAVFAQVWAGTPSFKGDLQVLAKEGAERVEHWLASLDAEEDIKDTAVLDLLKGWEQWHSDVDVTLSLYQLTPKAEQQQADAKGREDTKE